MKHLTFILAFTGALAIATPALALVIVVGTPKAEECFLAAKGVAELRSGDIEGGIKVCQSALDDGNLAAHDRAGTYINLGVLYAAREPAT